MTDSPTPPSSAPAAGQVLVVPLLAALTLGLAPFVPEPHIVGKLRWLAGGAVGMGPMDWFDLVFHGFPWVWLIGASVVFAVRAMQARGSADPE